MHPLTGRRVRLAGRWLPVVCCACGDFCRTVCLCSMGVLCGFLFSSTSCSFSTQNYPSTNGNVIVSSNHPSTNGHVIVSALHGWKFDRSIPSTNGNVNHISVRGRDGAIKFPLTPLKVQQFRPTKSPTVPTISETLVTTVPTLSEKHVCIAPAVVYGARPLGCERRDTPCGTEVGELGRGQKVVRGESGSR